MTIAQMNARLAAGAHIVICPWTNATSNQALVTVKAVAGNRTVTYTWEGLNGEPVEQTSQVSVSTWQYLVESLST